MFLFFFLETIFFNLVTHTYVVRLMLEKFLRTVAASFTNLEPFEGLLRVVQQKGVAAGWWTEPDKNQYEDALEYTLAGIEQHHHLADFAASLNAEANTLRGIRESRWEEFSTPELQLRFLTDHFGETVIPLDVAHAARGVLEKPTFRPFHVIYDETNRRMLLLEQHPDSEDTTTPVIPGLWFTGPVVSITVHFPKSLLIKHADGGYQSRPRKLARSEARKRMERGERESECPGWVWSDDEFDDRDRTALTGDYEDFGSNARDGIQFADYVKAKRKLDLESPPRSEPGSPSPLSSPPPSGTPAVHNGAWEAPWLPWKREDGEDNQRASENAAHESKRDLGITNAEATDAVGDKQAPDISRDLFRASSSSSPLSSRPTVSPKHTNAIRRSAWITSSTNTSYGHDLGYECGWARGNEPKSSTNEIVKSETIGPPPTTTVIKGSQFDNIKDLGWHSWNKPDKYANDDGDSNKENRDITNAHNDLNTAEHLGTPLGKKYIYIYFYIFITYIYIYIPIDALAFLYTNAHM